MTSNGNLKRRVRSRAAKTGESYAAARRHFHSAQPGDARPGGELMRQAGSAGARIIHFPEGATCSPSKRIMSVTGPAEVGPADWDRADWQVLRHELAANTKLSFMYTPGSGPVTFDVDGLRFGCAMGIEVHYPEVFAEYERLDVDGVLISTGPSHSPEGTAAFATEAQAHAATNSP